MLTHRLYGEKGLNMKMSKDEMKTFVENAYRAEAKANLGAYLKGMTVAMSLMGFDDDCVRELKQMATTKFKEISENLVTLP